jgi:hypothetical protein
MTVFAVMISLSFSGNVFAGTLHFGQRSLQDLKGVHIGVEPLTQNTKDAGLTKEMVKQDLESRLDKAKIKIVSAKESLFSVPGAPSLTVSVKVLETPCPGEESPRYTYTIDLRLIQGVVLARDEQIALHTDTWRANDFGQIDKLDDLRTKIKEIADEFAHSYKAANSGDDSTQMPVPPESKFMDPEMPPLEKK